MHFSLLRRRFARAIGVAALTVSLSLATASPGFADHGPALPTDVAAEALNATTILVTWSDTSTDEWLRTDISARSLPPVDWKNRSYSMTCGGIVPGRFEVTLFDGFGAVAGASAGTNEYDDLIVGLTTTATGNLTGDGASETAVLLACSPQPSNFFVEELQVFTADNTPLGELPHSDSLDSQGILPPKYVPEEVTIRDGLLATGMNFYGPGDTHASGPTDHRTLVWRWNGKAFEPAG